MTQLSPIDEPATRSQDEDDRERGSQVLSSTPQDANDSDLAIEMLQLLLPRQTLVIRLVEYHFNSLLWYHGSFHGPTFLQPLSDFDDKYHGEILDSGVDMQWVAVLFAILCGSIACGSRNSLPEWGFREGEQELISREWHHVAITCLNSADYMASASIRACEAIATLTISAHILGYSNQQAVPLASAARIAESLGLHRLDDSLSKTVERETGRRVWTQL